MATENPSARPADNPIFYLEGVSRRFGRLQALRDIDFKVSTGKTTVLIGPSGCGKSTMLRLMVGLIAPDAGRIFFAGKRLLPENLLPLRRCMGYVIQDGGLFPHLTARRNATIMARYLQWPLDRIESRLAELCELTQFPKDALARYPAQLSGGQCQRVSLMRALLLDPHVLLMDEPLGALDPMIRADLQQDLRSVFRKLGKSVVMVTHDLHEAAYFGDIVVLMRGGRIIQQGPLHEHLHAPKDPFVTRFISAQRTELDAVVGDRT